jgi:hypothetical protein
MYPRRHVHCIVFISCLCHYGALLVPTIYTLHSMCMYVCKYVSMYCLIFVISLFSQFMDTKLLVLWVCRENLSISYNLLVSALIFNYLCFCSICAVILFSGALSFLETRAKDYIKSFNIIVAPCVSPWGFETINRWNARAVDPNRSFIPNSEQLKV